MALPTRSQADWDDELNNHINALDADVQSAAARSVVAASDAAYARNRADEVHTAVVGGAEALFATEARSKGGVTYLDSYPRTGGETDDAPRLGRALAAMAASGSKVLQLGASTYTLASATTVSVAYLTIRGAGRQATTLEVTGDHIGLNVTGHYVVLEDLKVSCTTTARTVYPVKFASANHGAVQRCYFTSVDGGWRSGVHFDAGSMGSVFDSTFNHSCIYINTWDVKVDRCYLWAMSCEFGIGLATGTGNANITNTDVVPPLTATTNGKAGIYFENTGGFNTKLSDVYLDGSWPSLVTRPGVWITNGCAAIQMTSITANQMKSDVIVIDSAYNILLNGYSGYKNNDNGLGAREIVVKQTGAQPIDNVRLLGVHCLRTTAVTGSAAPAIEVESPVVGASVTIHDFDIKQPSGGGGYTLPEVKFHSLTAAQAASVSGSGELSVYSAHGSASVAAGATGATINLGSPYPMAWRPLVGDVTLHWESGGSTHMPSHRVAFTADNQIFVGFAAATSGTATIHWRVSFRRR